MKYIIAVLAIAALSKAQIFDRPCRTAEEFEVKEDFNKLLYIGTWFEIERYEAPQQMDTDCVIARYTAGVNDTINVGREAFIIANGTFIQNSGQAVLSFPDEIPLRAMLNVTFSPDQPSVSNYWIIATDYNTYSVVVSCNELGDNQSQDFYWLLSRGTSIDEKTRERVDGLIERFFEPDLIRTTVQDFDTCIAVRNGQH